LVEVDSIPSTQDSLAGHVRTGAEDVAVIRALTQTAGRGRFEREWHSPRGCSFSISIALFDYRDWPKPELLGIALAIAAAETAACDLAWPNDLVHDSNEGLRKVGGVLGEMVRTPDGSRVPVIGIGLNLRPGAFPDDIPGVSLEELGKQHNGDVVLSRLIDAVEHVPEPTDWAALAGDWSRRDKTAGKSYILPGDRIGRGVGISDHGHLIVAVDGEIVESPSADLVFKEV
jgi:BirA family biotin operon repressor/biotin-[acetyl-CoA-carboxylase] ligase